MSQSRRRFRLTRDGILFIAGLLGIAFETLAEHGDRPALLVLFGAMIGLPAFLNRDEKTTPPSKVTSKQEED